MAIKDKLFSGRWILTVISGGAFLYMVMNKTMPPEAASAIISMVFVSYFNRKQVENEGTNIHSNGSN